MLPHTLRSWLSSALSCVCLALIPAAGSAADSAWTLPLEGVLQSSTGVAINGDVAVTIRLYGSPEGGTALWSEAQTLSLSNGRYSTALGVTTALPEPLPDDVWIGVTVASDAEMTPRVRLRSAPRALRMPNLFAKGSYLGIGTANPQSALDIYNPGGEGLRLLAKDWYIRFFKQNWPIVPGIAVNGDGQLVLTNASNRMGNYAILLNSGAWTTISDRRLKEDIRPSEGLLDRALRLRPVTYHLRNEDLEPEPQLHLGFVAQDVEPLFPSLVANGEYKSLNYAGMSVVAIGALQEYIARNDAAVDRLRAENDGLRSANADLESRVGRLERIVGRMPAQR